MRRRPLLTLNEQTPAEKKAQEREKERMKKEAEKKAKKEAEAKVSAAERGAKSSEGGGALSGGGAAPPPPPAPASPVPPMGGPVPEKDKIKIPKLPPDELPRKEKPIKKKSPRARARSILKATERRHKYLQKVVRDFYGVLNRPSSLSRPHGGGLSLGRRNFGAG